MRTVKREIVLNAKATTWVWTTLDVSNYRNVVVKIWTASSANLTVKCQWAVWAEPPDFSAAQSVANNWDYVQMVDLQDGSAINWDTWFVATWTDDFRLLEVNTNSLNYLTFNVTARSAWSVTVEVTLTDNL